MWYVTLTICLETLAVYATIRNLKDLVLFDEQINIDGPLIWQTGGPNLRRKEFPRTPVMNNVSQSIPKKFAPCSSARPDTSPGRVFKNLY